MQTVAISSFLYHFYSQLYLAYLDQSRRLCNRQKIYKLRKIFVQKIKGNNHNKVKHDLTFNQKVIIVADAFQT